MRPVTKDKDGAAAGTAERLTPDSIYDNSVFIEAKAANTTNMFVGAANVSGVDDGVTLIPGQGITYDVQDAPKGQIDLSEIWIDAATSAEGVTFTYLKRV